MNRTSLCLLLLSQLGTIFLHAQEADHKDMLDSFSYSNGIVIGYNIKADFLTSLNITELKQGLHDKKNNEILKFDENQQRQIFQEFLILRDAEGGTFTIEQLDKLSYAIGADLVYKSILKTPIVDVDILIEAMNKVLMGENLLMSHTEAQNIYSDQLKKFNQRLNRENRIKGEAFLAENGTRAEVVTTASGLQYEILVEGKGPFPQDTSNVKVHYHGTYIDGSVFDSSIERGETNVFSMTYLILGWTEALLMMPQGSRWVLYIPTDLAYGDRGSGGVVEPGATLIFEVELLDIF